MQPQAAWPPMRGALPVVAIFLLPLAAAVASELTDPQGDQTTEGSAGSLFNVAGGECSDPSTDIRAVRVDRDGPTTRVTLVHDAPIHLPLMDCGGVATPADRRTFVLTTEAPGGIKFTFNIVADGEPMPGCLRVAHAFHPGTGLCVTTVHVDTAGYYWELPTTGMARYQGVQLPYDLEERLSVVGTSASLLRQTNGGSETTVFGTRDRISGFVPAMT